MDWLQLRFPLEAQDPERVEALLMDLGAQAVTLLEGEGAAPVLEPDRGTTPLWDDTRISALFPADSDPASLTLLLVAELGLAPSQIDMQPLEDRAWEREWMKDFHPMRFGDRLWIIPTGHEPPDEAGSVVLELDPGLAFGTGTHPTTAMCLEWLDETGAEGLEVLDYGCGSGVLAIAALKLGAERVVCVDHDPQAVVATRDNARRNRVEDRLTVHLPEDLPDGCFDLVIANILAGPLVKLADTLAPRVRPGGRIVLSGILGVQAEAVDRAYRSEGIASPLALLSREEWVRMSGTRTEDR